MHWYAKHTRPKFNEGDVRLHRIFAFIPVYIEGVMVFFETYEVLQVYRITEQKIKLDGEEVVFSPGQWINLTKRCK